MDTDRAVPVIRFVNGQRRVGSGYRITRRYVLTAAHCVTGLGHRVWLTDGERRVRVVADGRRSEVDLAIVEIAPDIQAGEAPVAGVVSTPCARVDRTTPGKLGDCVAVGYPEFAVHQDAPFTTAQVDGWIPTASGLMDTADGRRTGHLVLKAEGSPPRALPTTETRLGRTPWAGMSGAAVFAAGCLVGVVAEHHLPEGDGSLTLVPIDWVNRVRNATDRALMLEALEIASTEDLELLSSGATTRRRWISVIPPVPQVLVDRPAQAEELRRAVLAGSNTLVVVSGMGGAGKSVLAARLARAAVDGTDFELAACYPDGATWVSVGHDRPPVTAQLELARALGEEHPELGEDWRSNRIRLHQLVTSRRGLVVLDDVWTAEDYEPYRLDTPGLQVVITTRNHKLATDLGAVMVPVGELEASQARELLAKATETAVGELPEEADEVLAELGYLAFGVAIVGATAAERGPRAWPGLLQRLRERRFDKLAHRFADNYQYVTLLRAIEVAVDDLDSNDQEHWAELAIFDRQGDIPRSAMQALWSLADEDDLDTDDRIDRLIRRSLIQRASFGYRLHDLQYNVARLRLGTDLEAAQRRLMDGYQQQVIALLDVANLRSWTALPTSQMSALSDYELDYLVDHLRAAGRELTAIALLSDYDFISLRVSRRGFNKVLQDYGWLPDDHPLRLIYESLINSSKTSDRRP